MTTLTIKGTTYKVLAEESMIGYKNIDSNNNGKVVSTLILTKPKGTKEFWATRDERGDVTLN